MNDGCHFGQSPSMPVVKISLYNRPLRTVSYSNNRNRGYSKDYGLARPAPDPWFPLPRSPAGAGEGRAPDDGF